VTGPQAVAVLDLLTEAGIRCWIGGGWGIDALVGIQTRDHGDLDVVAHPGEPARDLLVAAAFEPVVDWWPVRVALRHADGHEVDLHPVERIDDGWLQQGLDGTTYTYPDSELTLGNIAGRVVPVISAALQLRFHQGYEPSETDRTDIAHLVAAELLPPDTEI
jgi:lincosamide nucleotidyltransferase A/C/D/E